MAALKYRGQHPQLRAQLLAVLKPGTPCRQIVRGKICGQPMWPGIQELHLGHDDHGGYIGIVHARCNEQAGAINSNRGRGRTCRRCKQKFTPTRRRQSRCATCRQLTTTPVTVTAGGRAW